MLKVKTENSRCNWGNEETKDLLSIMKEHKVMDLLDGKTRRNKNVYVLLADELSKKGYKKSSDQVKLKFRTLKKDFLKTKRGNSKSGAGRTTVDHYQDLEELLGDRPVAAAVGLDTTVVDDDFLEEREENIMEHMFEVCDEPEIEYSAESLAHEPQQNVEKGTKKKGNAIQMTLLEIAADVKESHQSTLQMMREENDAFLAEQRRLQEEYIKDTKEIMAEDRRETRKMLHEIFNK